MSGKDPDIDSIRTRYKVRYSDGSVSDWMPIPDPRHPSFLWGPNWDDLDIPPWIKETEGFKRDLLALKTYPEVHDKADSALSYLSGYAVTMPVEYNEKTVSKDVFQCDLGPEWRMNYHFDRENEAFILDGIIRDAEKHPRVLGATVEMRLTRDEHRMVRDFMNKEQIEGDFWDRAFDLILDSIKSDPYTYEVSRTKAENLSEEYAESLVLDMDLLEFFAFQQIAYGPSRDPADVLVGVLSQKQNRGPKAYRH